MGSIRVLDKATINKIAAGEVVNRPVSIVKELVENAIDADATRIIIDVNGGGRDYISITDNGHGMDKDDAELCFHRHATSKIRDIQDLFFIETMGFRGEAISSISAISKFTLRTKRKENEEGVEIIYEDNQQVSIQELPMDNGTRIIVEDVFYNVPARLKYLKKERTELQHIIRYVQSVSLLYPKTSFTLKSNGKKLFNVSGQGDIQEIMKEVFTEEVRRQMIPVDEQCGGIHVAGYISTPQATRVDREKQIIAVNRRVVQNDLLSKALRKAVYTYFPQQRHPYCFMHVRVDASEVDVNIHPSKSDVRFSTERQVRQCLIQGIQNTFITHSFKRTDMGSQNEEQSQSQLMLSTHTIRRRGWESSVSGISGGKQDLYNTLFTPETTLKRERILSPDDLTDDQDYSAPIDTNNHESHTEMDTRGILQLDNTYLIFILQGDLYVIDQHIAHERILYERLKSKKQPVESQELLIPETIMLDAADAIILKDVMPALSEYGFGIESFGHNSFILRSVPVFLTYKDTKQLMMDILDDIDTKEKSQQYEKLIISLSCRGAIKAGNRLRPIEREELVDEWLNTENNMSCPHGRPIAKRLSGNDLAKWFLRSS